MGANMIWIEAGNRNVGGVRTGSYGSRSLLVGDAKAIQQQIALVANVSPSVDTRVQLIRGNQNWNLSVRGVAPEYLAVKSWPIAQGEMFTTRDIDAAANVCVLGSTVVGELFTDEDPIGQTIRVNGEECKIVGVLAAKGQSVTGQDQDDTMMMPYTTVMKKLMGHWWLDDMMMSAVSAEVQPAAEEEIRTVLRDRHHLQADEPDDFNIRHPTEIAQVVAESARTMEVLLASVAAHGRATCSGSSCSRHFSSASSAACWASDSACSRAMSSRRRSGGRRACRRTRWPWPLEWRGPSGWCSGTIPPGARRVSIPSTPCALSKIARFIESER
jgi:putative ABC transport system permease protein